MIASVIVTAAAIEIVRSATVRYVGSFQSSRKLSSVQLWIVSDVNGSTVQKAAERRRRAALPPRPASYA